MGVNGLWLAGSVDGVDTQVMFLFALLHDTMRQNDGHAPEPGRLAATFAVCVLGAGVQEQVELRCADPEQPFRVELAGTVSTDPTVGACWDADRLDLPRVGVTPRPELFSTEAARTVLASHPPGPSCSEHAAAGHWL